MTSESIDSDAHVMWLQGIQIHINQGSVPNTDTSRHIAWKNTPTTNLVTNL